jgi:hypothetical protein
MGSEEGNDGAAGIVGACYIKGAGVAVAIDHGISSAILLTVPNHPACPAYSELGGLATLMILKRSLRSGSRDGGRHDRDH